jgi:hypothetical protein
LGAPRVAAAIQLRKCLHKKESIWRTLNAKVLAKQGVGQPGGDAKGKAKPKGKK